VCVLLTSLIFAIGDSIWRQSVELRSDMAYVYTCSTHLQGADSLSRQKRTYSYDSRLVLFAPSRAGAEACCGISLEQTATLSLSEGL
jgi:hypothetical protein